MICIGRYVYVTVLYVLVCNCAYFLYWSVNVCIIVLTGLYVSVIDVLACICMSLCCLYWSVFDVLYVLLSICIYCTCMCVFVSMCMYCIHYPWSTCIFMMFCRDHGNCEHACRCPCRVLFVTPWSARNQKDPPRFGFALDLEPSKMCSLISSFSRWEHVLWRKRTAETSRSLLPLNATRSPVACTSCLATFLVSTFVSALRTKRSIATVSAKSTASSCEHTGCSSMVPYTFLCFTRSWRVGRSELLEMMKLIVVRSDDR